jgi:hypothetical protein
MGMELVQTTTRKLCLLSYTCSVSNAAAFQFNHPEEMLMPKDLEKLHVFKMSVLLIGGGICSDVRNTATKKSRKIKGQVYKKSFYLKLPSRSTGST